jgi:hypothetical protein
MQVALRRLLSAICCIDRACTYACIASHRSHTHRSNCHCCNIRHHRGPNRTAGEAAQRTTLRRYWKILKSLLQGLLSRMHGKVITQLCDCSWCIVLRDAQPPSLSVRLSPPLLAFSSAATARALQITGRQVAGGDIALGTLRVASFWHRTYAEDGGSGYNSEVCAVASPHIPAPSSFHDEMLPVEN